MKRLLPLSLLCGLALLGACVTINVYFPAAAAEKAADRIIDDVWGGKKAAPPPQPQSRLDGGALLGAAFDFVLPAAHAEPNLDISSSEIQMITTSMEQRHPSLQPYLDSGVVGLTSNGDIAVRDANLVPLASRNAVRALVNQENSDRAALYRQIAVANGQPQWEAQIRSVFAQRWIAKASAGWWYQDAGGGWKQK